MKKGSLAVVFILLLLAFSGFASAGLGLYPALREYNFAPNEQMQVTYTVYSDNPEKKISIYAEEDLANYTTFDKSYVIGGGQFTVTLNLPSSIDKPGRNKLFIVAEEEPDGDSFIGTSIKLRALISVRVPYPGKYIEAGLNIPNVNIGEKVPVELKVTSRGADNVSVTPVITFYDSARNVVDSMSFDSVVLATNGEKYFRRYLENPDLKPDDYIAEANIDYETDEPMVINSTFRIGNLRVDVINFTQNLSAGELNKFFIRIKSNWNAPISNVYADVNVSRGNYSNMFRTPPVDLAAFQERDLEGYIDTKGMSSGDYMSEIKLSYLGQTTYYSGKVTLIGGSEFKIIWVAYGVGVGVLLAVLLIIIYFLIKRFKKRK